MTNIQRHGARNAEAHLTVDGAGVQPVRDDGAAASPRTAAEWHARARWKLGGPLWIEATRGQGDAHAALAGGYASSVISWPTNVRRA